MTIKDVLEILRDEKRPVYRAQLADAIEAAMRERKAYISHTSQGDVLDWEPQFDAPSRTKLYAFPPDAAGELLRITEQLAKRDAEIERLRGALEFYADPETYFGIAVIGDPPCGAFVEDFSDDHGHPYLDGPRYGKTARAALAGKELPK